mgnify:CR=1 FL=1
MDGKASDPPSRAKRVTVPTEKGIELRQHKLHEVQRHWKGTSKKVDAVIELLRNGESEAGAQFLELFDKLCKLRVEHYQRASVEVEAVSHDHAAADRWHEFRTDADSLHRNRETELRRIYEDVVGVTLPRSSTPTPPNTRMDGVDAGDHVVMVTDMLAAAVAGKSTSSALVIQQEPPVTSASVDLLPHGGVVDDGVAPTSSFEQVSNADVDNAFQKPVTSAPSSGGSDRHRSRHGGSQRSGSSRHSNTSITSVQIREAEL